MGEPWFVEHPYRAAILQNIDFSIPRRIWGDGATVNKSWKLFVVTFESIMSALGPTLLSRYLAFAVALHRFVNLGPLWRVLGWSLKVLASGRMPCLDHLGRAFKEGSKRWLASGQQICGECCFFLSQFSGDLVFLMLEQGCNFNDVCFLCHATKAFGDMCAYNFQPEAPWMFTRRCHHQYMIGPGGGCDIAQHLPGWHLGMVKMDLMHGLHQGCLPIINGSAMHFVLERNYFGGPTTGEWRNRWGQQLVSAFAQFSAFLKCHKITCSHVRFTIAQLSLGSLQNPPNLKAKAGNSMLISRWLLSIFLRLAVQSPCEKNELIATSLWGWVSAIDLLKSFPMFLNAEQQAQIEQCRIAALGSHSVLCCRSIAEGRQQFRTIPKHHSCDHLLRDRRNPTHSWTFADEDFIGRLVRMSRRSSNTKTIISKYLLRLHLVVNINKEGAPQL